MSSIDLSIIIVNFNTNYLLFNCLSSIKECVSVNYEVIVVDNASTDDSFSRCDVFSDDPRFHLFRLNDNYGFSKGNNMAVERSSGRFLHFLNPDTKVSCEINRDYSLAFSLDDKVFVNPLLNRDGSLENADRVVPTLKDIFWWNVCRSKARYWCLGASVIVSRDVFYRLGGWCEDYFMYSEDLDFFYNVWLNGLEIVHLSAPVYHFGGGSSGGLWSALERESAVQISFRKFYSKYFSKCQYVAVKCYFVAHDLFRHPAKTFVNIKAWKMVSKYKY